MNKLWLIFKREYLTRVTKRTFILATILTPIGIGLSFFVAIYLQTYQSDKQSNFIIVDEGGFLKDTIGKKKGYTFEFSTKDIMALKNNFDAEKYTGIVYLSKTLDVTQKKLDIDIFTDEKLSIDTRMNIENLISDRIESYKMSLLGLDKKMLDKLNVRISLDPEPITAGKNNESSMGSVITTVLGAAMGLIMYLTLFIYGMMVMRSVMEEKTNRIVEVMISSVRPFELMLGKILGVAAIALTQLAIWGVLTTIIFSGIITFMGVDTATAQSVTMNDASMQAMEASKDLNPMAIIAEIEKVNWWFILPMFVIYFICGYLLYSSLFAAVGSAMGDDSGEGQALTIPITIPIVLAVYIMFHTIKEPNSSLSVFASIFPLFSPIVMPARLGFDPPLWQVLCSVATLIGSTIFLIWLSGRIYRVGILLYGKKASFKEIAKWVFSNE